MSIDWAKTKCDDEELLRLCRGLQDRIKRSAFWNATAICQELLAALTKRFDRILKNEERCSQAPDHEEG